MKRLHEAAPQYVPQLLQADHVDGAGITMAVDNLSVSAVPEPETYAMLLAGLGLMGAIARRRENRAA